MYNSLILLFSSHTIYILITCFVLTLILFASECNLKVLKKKLFKSDGKLCYVDENENETTKLKEAPGPKPYPIVGNLPVLDGYDVPYQAFTDLAEKYGPIIKLRMGNVPTMVVNGIDNIKEVLIHKANHFDSRPNFKRYDRLFSGNKENSLAFCDWSEVQKVRREMLNNHTFPRKFSMSFNRLNDITLDHYEVMACEIRQSVEQNQAVSIKPIIVETCANIFSQYFTTRAFDKNDDEFQKMIKNFDKVFWEVNQGYAADFLPFLMPLHSKNLKKMEQWSHEIREFILKNIISDRYEAWNVGNEPNDYIDSLIDHVKQDLEPKMDWHTALFALEDIIGGHAAVSNFLVKVLAFVAPNKHVQQKIQAEVDAMLNERSEKSVLISDRNQLLYTEAVIMESLRLISSPIVPHVANQDSEIDGFAVKKDTLIFLNNYDLSMSPKLWIEPEKFMPERFLSSGRLIKPDHFLPFGAGKRSCMGYKMVQFLAFSILGNIMKEFDISTINNEAIKVPVGSLAMQEDPYHFIFTARN